MSVLFFSRSTIARYIVHYMDWAVISTISSRYDGIPFGSIISISDGPETNGTGVPYIYISPLDQTSKNFLRNPKASFAFSEAQSDYCERKNFDPEDPRCARLTLYGQVKLLDILQKNEVLLVNPKHSQFGIKQAWTCFP